MAEHVGIKVVTKKLKDGTVRRYKYYQLVKTYRKEGKHRTEYVRYLGKEIPPEFQHRHHVLANRDRASAPLDSLPLDVLANQNKEEEEHDPLVPPEKRPTKAVCPRCGREFVLTWFERELGHTLCPRCR